MITTNVISRIFFIRIGDSIGTCFTIDVDGKQYAVTARHLVSSITGTQRISMFYDNVWKSIDVKLIGHCDDKVDISVLSTNWRLSSDFAMIPTVSGIGYGQDVYFLGFPYGMTGGVADVNRNFPLPFVKKAIVSCIHITPSGEQLVLLDGHNNPGFSGGPVIFLDHRAKIYKVAAVITGRHFEKKLIYHDDQKLPLAYEYDTGIVISYGIKHAVDLIKSNPAGYDLSA